MTAREATPADALRLVDLVNAAYRQAEGHFISGQRIDEAELRQRMATGRFLVVDGPDGTLASCVYLRINGDRVYLGLLAVDPRLQKQGIGSALLDQAEAYCASHGCSAIDIDVVNLRTGLLDFYAVRGFRPTGTVPFDDPRLKQPAHFVQMSKALLPQL
jgi:GNAT superfamily N-acetyltransferase